MLNPSIPDAGLQNIGRKIEKTLKEIEAKAKDKHSIVMLGVQDEKSDELFFKSRSLIGERTKKRVLLFRFTDEDITEADFVAKLKEVA